MAGPISQIQTNGQLVRFENLHPSIARVLLFFIAGLLLRLERVVHWERIASRWRPAFSSHLISSIKGVKEKTPFLQPDFLLPSSPPR